MELKIESFNRREVLQYLAWRGGEIPPDIDALIDSAMAETLSAIRPQYIWRPFDLEMGERVRLPAAGLELPGADVRELLADCRQCVLLAATLGADFDRLVARTQPRDMALALVLDSCGSAAIEAVCDAAEAQIRAALGGDVCLTDRFSPGYGDLPLETEKPLVAVLDTARRIGLTLTESCILLPRKSVTAVIGLASTPQTKRFRGCAWCSLFENCAYRKAGRNCGKA